MCIAFEIKHYHNTTHFFLLWGPLLLGQRPQPDGSCWRSHHCWASTLILSAKYLVFVSSCSVKTRELSFAQFLHFLRKVCLIFNFKIHSEIQPPLCILTHFLSILPCNRYHIKASDNTHQTVEISPINTFPSNLNPKFNHFDSVLLFLFLTN